MDEVIDFGKIGFKNVELIDKKIVRAETTRKFSVDELSQSFLKVYQEKIDEQIVLGPKVVEMNATSYTLNIGSKPSGTVLHIVEYQNSMGLTCECYCPIDGEKIFRILRAQRLRQPTIENIQDGMEMVIATILWETGAIEISLGDIRPFFMIDNKPCPIYIDVRRLTQYPAEYEIVLAYAKKLIGRDFDFVCGGEAGGLMFASDLARMLDKPKIWVREKPKAYLGASQIEGVKPYELFGKKVLLVEDAIATGRKKGIFIKALTNCGAKVDKVLVIFDREEGGAEVVRREGAQLYALTNIRVAFWNNRQRFFQRGYFTENEQKVLEDYLGDQDRWRERLTR
ncbi:MAG: phosphoribosyltransferase family protein [candidate division WOR-3 bacterium]